MDNDLEKSRRNVMVTSVVIMLLSWAEGSIGSVFGVVHFEREWVVRLFLWLAWGWFIWRFNNHARPLRREFKIATLRRLHSAPKFITYVESILETDEKAKGYDNVQLYMKPQNVDIPDFKTSVELSLSSGERTHSADYELSSSEYHRFIWPSYFKEAYYGDSFANIVAPYLFVIAAMATGVLKASGWLISQLLKVLGG